MNVETIEEIRQTCRSIDRYEDLAAGPCEDDDRGSHLFRKEQGLTELKAILAGLSAQLTPESTTAVRAKMQCNYLETLEFQYGKQRKVKLGAVYSDKGENKAFTDSTPSGGCEMTINDGRPAAAFFKPGKSYYVTFTEAPD